MGRIYQGGYGRDIPRVLRGITRRREAGSETGPITRFTVGQYSQDRAFASFLPFVVKVGTTGG